MLRADRDTDQATRRPRSRGRLVARTAREAINETERRLCAGGAVSRAPVAEGLALGGRRAATLLGVDGANASGADETTVRAAWVHHRFGSAPSDGFAFELAASTAQHAVDHCLVAQDLARLLAAPGLCSFDAALSRPIALVRLPDETMALELDDEPAVAAITSLDDEAALLTAAARSFERVSRITGRPLRAVTSDGPQDADQALVVSGTEQAAAQRLARALERQGLPCRVICVHLIRPFPASALGEAVAGVKNVLLIPGGDNLLEMKRRAVVEAGSATAAVLLPAPDDADAADAARLAFGLEATQSSPAASATAPPAVLTARPLGDWADRFLLDVAARLGATDEIALSSAAADLLVGQPGMSAAEEPATELALCAHASFLESGGLISGMAHGSALVIASSHDVPVGWWEALRPETRRALLEKKLQLKWINLGAAADLDLADHEAVREILLNGFLSAGARCLTRAMGTELEFPDPPGSMIELDLDALESNRLAQDSSFKPTPGRMATMPEPAEAADDTRWRDAARRFHLSGEGAHSASEPTQAEPLHPAVIEAIEAPTRLASRYPLFVGLDEEQIAISFESRAAAILEELAADSKAGTILPGNLPRLSRTVGRVVSRKRHRADPAPIVAEAMNEFRKGFELSEAGAATLQAETDRLEAHLVASAEDSSLVGLDDDTLSDLYLAAVRDVRRRRRQEILEEVDSLVRRLEELIAIDDDHAPEGTSAEALSSTLGSGGSNFFDPQKLADHLPQHRGSVRLGASRRQRIESTLETLRAEMQNSTDIDLLVVQPISRAMPVDRPGVRVIAHARGLEAAIGLFDSMAERGAGLFRALRVARLEVDGAYDEETHAGPLARFGWESLTADELLSLPRLAVLETDDRLHGAALGAFSELLRSARPVQVLVAQNTSELRTAESWQGLAGFHPGLGYLAMAHREAFVVESSLVCPERLAHELTRMAASLRPAAAIVAVPSWRTAVHPWVQLLAAEEARAVPCFVYDPEAGVHWAERFDLEGNPQPERAWPVHAVHYLDAHGNENELEQPFTFAHAVALDPAYRDHFRIVPASAWSPEQIELSAYLAAPIAAMARKVPFIWVIDEERRLARALVTRELAYASRDRVRAWHILQELAGTDNEYVRRAAQTARSGALAEAEEARLARETEHAAEIERVRREAAGEAMDRLSRVLLNLDAAAIPASSTTLETGDRTELQVAPVGDAPAAADEEDEPVAEEEDDEADISFDDPYVTSALCTSCQECIDINSRLFKYDSNKQAFITDRANGTYEELVRAAEKCPARCIHPGAPASGDETVNEDLIARAVKFH